MEKWCHQCQKPNFENYQKKAKNLIFWKHDHSKFQTKWDILFTNMGLSDRHFISQPLEQRIITIWNKIEFSDFRNNQNQILKQENFPGKSPLRWSSLWERRSKRPHTLCWLKKFPKRGPGMKPPSISNMNGPLLHLYYHKQLHFRGDFPEKFPCFIQYLFLVIYEIRKFCFVSNFDYILF